ncbi:MAG: class I SAM-dependent rRNA methyltransferase, partial [Terriglobales bacterium]
MASANAGPGDVVAVRDGRGRLLGSALYSSASEIALRLISPSVIEAEAWPGLVRQRTAQALQYRERMVRDSDACRLVFSESDALPGLIVDRYNDVLSFQVLTQGMDRETVRSAILETLVERLAPAGVVERVDARIRALEKLPPVQDHLVKGEKTTTLFTMNGVRFHYEALAGQKTGAFLDQRENYAAAARYARGEALDVFCYQGGFALHLARVCGGVTAVDSSRPALEAAERNEELNRASLKVAEIEWIEANAFDLLKDYAAGGRQFDTIILDPPPFARTRRTVAQALRGYKEINLRALKMLRPGGLLVTCSCSFHVSEAEFLEMLAAAAQDAHRSLRILEKRGQPADHPVLLGIPET